jgi:hypothetical protein
MSAATAALVTPHFVPAAPSSVSNFIWKIVGDSPNLCKICELRMLASPIGWTGVPGGATYGTWKEEVFHASPNEVMVEARQLFCQKMREPGAQPCCNCLTILRVYQQKGL